MLKLFVAIPLNCCWNSTFSYLNVGFHEHCSLYSFLQFIVMCFIYEGELLFEFDHCISYFRKLRILVFSSESCLHRLYISVINFTFLLFSNYCYISYYSIILIILYYTVFKIFVDRLFSGFYLCFRTAIFKWLLWSSSLFTLLFSGWCCMINFFYIKLF